MGVSLFAGIPLIAWGIFDARTYFGNIHRTLYTILMILSTLLVVLFVPNQGRDSREGPAPVARQKLAVLFLQVVSLLVVMVSPISDKHGFMTMANEFSVRTIGLVSAFVGYFLMNWSVVVLGKQFSINVTIQQGHELITHGPYRLIRHPRYLGIILFLGGIALVFDSLLSLMLILITVMVLIWRISEEEKLMRDTFLNAWDEYRKRTWRLIPYVY